MRLPLNPVLFSKLHSAFMLQMELDLGRMRHIPNTEIVHSILLNLREQIKHIPFTPEEFQQAESLAYTKAMEEMGVIETPTLN